MGDILNQPTIFGYAITPWFITLCISIIGIIVCAILILAGLSKREERETKIIDKAVKNNARIPVKPIGTVSSELYGRRPDRPLSISDVTEAATGNSTVAVSGLSATIGTEAAFKGKGNTMSIFDSAAQTKTGETAAMSNDSTAAMSENTSTVTEPALNKATERFEDNPEQNEKTAAISDNVTEAMTDCVTEGMGADKKDAQNKEVTEYMFNFCPQCGKKVTGNFCANCGHKTV